MYQDLTTSSQSILYRTFEKQNSNLCGISRFYPEFRRGSAEATGSLMKFSEAI